jgi:sulfhydrogenase subunit beta (sulfur reductase)
MMDYKILQKGNLDNFIRNLSSRMKVVAPVKREYDSYSFEEVRNSRDISLKYIPTILPPKKYFMPQHETLIEYDTTTGQKMQAVVEFEKMVLFGVHTCDIAGIQCLDIVFSDRPRDLNYLIRRNEILIIGIECNVYCDSFANCAMMDTHMPGGGYDMMFTDMGDYFIVDIHTQAGDDLASVSGLFDEAGGKQLKELENLRSKKREIFVNEVGIDRNELPGLFVRGFDADVWNEIGNRCLACGNCTNVCPTCYCFDVDDIPNLDLKSGKRVRIWDSCQSEPFAKIAGGESFRKERSDRKRHRFNRKFKYPVDRNNHFFCTGCGRCSRTCMAKINLKETIRVLHKECEGYRE